MGMAGCGIMGGGMCIPGIQWAPGTGGGIITGIPGIIRGIIPGYAPRCPPGTMGAPLAGTPSRKKALPAGAPPTFASSQAARCAALRGSFGDLLRRRRSGRSCDPSLRRLRRCGGDGLSLSPQASLFALRLRRRRWGLSSRSSGSSSGSSWSSSASSGQARSRGSFFLRGFFPSAGSSRGAFLRRRGASCAGGAGSSSRSSTSSFCFFFFLFTGSSSGGAGSSGGGS
mmetsp:Transcript_28807/g.68508  ORF Transcript_28807/g.68508 Transcript_28807/m.68508 type:complete len:227 (+) Transcript_28807:46-726(+)